MNLGGLTYSSQSLRDLITAAGWSVVKVSFNDKRDKYEALARDERGSEIKQVGRTERLALSNLLMAVTKANGHRRSFKLGRWKTNFSDQLAEVAQAYAKAPLYDSRASASFMALAKDSERRAEVLGQHLQILVVNNPEPYKGPDQMIDDIKKRRKLEVSRVGANQHPIWTPEQVVAYRTCHDVLGYAAADAGWDWYGECEAFAAHVHLLPAEAQQALFTESIATAAYASYYQAYGPEKVAVFPQFMDRAQEAETGKAHPGVHPSQSFPPVELPAVKPLHEASVAWEDREPENAAQTLVGDLDGLHTAADNSYLDPSTLQDPNYQWQSGEAPILTNNGLTINQAYGDPLQMDTPNPETGETARTNAAKIIPRYPGPDVGTEWASLNRENPKELAVMKQAIVNAFRVVLLSPRKVLMANAIHYQDIMHIPGDEDDPSVYWNTLENARRDWNEARGYDRFSHVPYLKYVPALINVMYQRDPDAGYDTALFRTQKLLFDWGTEIENKLMRMDAEKPEEMRRAGFQVESKANYIMEKRLKTYLAASKPNLDKAFTYQVKRQLKEEPPEGADYYRAAGVAADQDWLQKPDKRKYDAFMGSQVRAVAAISKYTDEILEAALQDVHEHNGAGWHFRSTVMQLNIPSVGPKVCSFAWLLLQPMTSELATIDTHILDTLGIHNDKQYNTRDYFGYERAFRARMDAAGYGHVPLGQLQWGMWDYKRTGPGSHQDHSPLRVLNPTPHENINWDERQQPINSAQALAHKRAWFTGQHPDAEWWTHTADAGTDAWEDWKTTMAPSVAKDQIPYQGLPLDYQPGDFNRSATPDLDVYTASLRTSALVPWFRHFQTGEEYTGSPGETNMQHLVRLTGLSVPEIWERFSEAGKREEQPAPWQSPPPVAPPI